MYKWVCKKVYIFYKIKSSFISKELSFQAGLVKITFIEKNY